MFGVHHETIADRTFIWLFDIFEQFGCMNIVSNRECEELSILKKNVQLS